MTIEEMEKLAEDYLDMARTHGQDNRLARFVLLVLPVVKAAVRFEDTRRAVIGGQDTHRELLGRSEDLENAIDTMRAALEGK